MLSGIRLKMMLCALLASAPALALANGYLENPQPDAVESGLGVISGWHCTANEVEIFIDGKSIGSTGVGSLRADTAATCGHSESGYALLYNFNNAEPGRHEIKLFVDGELLDTRYFNTVRSGGVPYLAGRSAQATIDNFPAPGKATRVEWSQAKQSFVVVGSADMATLDGSYTLRRVSIQTQHYGLFDTEYSDGIQASGTMRLAGTSYNQDIVFRFSASSAPAPITVRGNVVDMGFYLYDSVSGNQLVIVERGAAVITSLLYQEPTLGWSNEIQYWVKDN